MQSMRKILIAFFLLFPALCSAAPVISNVYVQSSTATTATIVWTTNVAATSQIKFGTDILLSYSNNVNTALVTSHSMTLTLLNASQPYYFAVVSTASGTTQSATYEFALCGTPQVPIQGSVDRNYGLGTYTFTWVPPSGAVGTPTVCGQTLQQTVTGTLDQNGAITAVVSDSMKVTPGPGTWHIAVTDLGNLAPISVTIPLSTVTTDISDPLQAAASASGLTACITNTVSGLTWPPSCAGGGGGGGISLATNGVANTSQALLNFLNSSTITFSNPTGGVETATVINTPAVGGITITGTPSIGMVPIATSPSTATWQTMSIGVTQVNTNSTTGITGGPITGTGTIACAQGSASQFGCVKVDGTTITATAGVLTAVNGGGTIASINSKTGPNIIIKSSNSSITVDNSVTNQIDLTTTTSGGFAATTNHLILADSRALVSLTQPTITVTAVSCNSGTNICTLTASNTLAAADIVQLPNSGWSPACLSNKSWYVETPVLASGLSGTQFQISETDTGCTGNDTGTGGAANLANTLYPSQMARIEPAFVGHGTIINHGVPGQTTTSALTNFSTEVTPWAPATTGKPTIAWVQLGSQDLLGCVNSAATVETNLQTYWANLHALNIKVGASTLINTFNSIFCDAQDGFVIVNEWMRGQGIVRADGKYWDYLADSDKRVGFAYNRSFFQQLSLDPTPDHLNDYGNVVVADSFNQAASDQRSNPLTDITGVSKGPIIADSTGMNINGYPGIGVYSSTQYAGNGNPGVFGLGIDESGSPSYGGKSPVIITPWPAVLAVMRFNQSDNGAVSIPSNSKYCWASSSANNKSDTSDSCIQRIAAKEFSFGNSTNGDNTGSIDMMTVLYKPVTFTTLTAAYACNSGNEGRVAEVSDSSTATWGATITGSGSSKVLAHCNGTNWTVIGN